MQANFYSTEVKAILEQGKKKEMGDFTLYYAPHFLQLKHVFQVAAGARTQTPIVLVALEYQGLIGYGEASMPPYLGESHDSVMAFLDQVDLSTFKSAFLLEDVLAYIDGIAPGNTAAKAALDIALHDVLGKRMGQPWYKVWGLDPEHTVPTSFTIGIDSPEMIRQKLAEATDFHLLKVKLGAGNDREIIETIRSVSDQAICVDANQGWSNREEALEMIKWLSLQNVVFVEQPMEKTAWEDHRWLKARSPLPIIADEAVQRLKDVHQVASAYHGINIKLMKCTGLYEARKMCALARDLDLKIMLGCMTETSCAISAASQLAPLADWLDLDGALLIKDDLFSGMQVQDGYVKLSDAPGIGLQETIH